MANVGLDVYCTDMDVEDAELGRFAGMLSDDERHRAAQFRFERDRRRWVARRGKLRELLSPLIGRAPSRIGISCNPFGKPCVRGSDVRFNLSHAQHVALYVIGAGLETGCDIVWRDPQFRPEQIPEWLFSARELQTLRSLAPARQAAGFFAWWTRKEALIKARGLGLSVPLDRFEVSAIPGEAAALLSGGEGWSVRSIESVPGFAAAVVAEGAGWELRLHALAHSGAACPDQFGAPRSAWSAEDRTETIRR